MSNRNEWVKCAKCKTEWPLDAKQCPKCGSAQKEVNKSIRLAIGIKATGRWIKTHMELKINWLVITLIWIITLVWIAITSFVVTGWLAFLLSIPVSLAIFFLGIPAFTKIIEKTTGGL